MFENKTHLFLEVNNRKYTLICDPESPLGELHDVICQFKASVVKRIQEVQESEEKFNEEKVNDDSKTEG